MTKQYRGEIWFQEEKGTVNIGFTKEFIQTVLTECYHITQAAFVLLVKDRPMLTIETNEGLKVIRSPVNGTVTFFSTDARDFPDRLTEDTIVVSIKPKQQVVMSASKRKLTEKEVRYPNNYFVNVNPPLNRYDIIDEEL
jgi:glycine cleavage system H lipoate-binding protein